jgi:hypothetical protein
LNAARILKLNVATETVEIYDLLRNRDTQESALKLVESLGPKGLPFLPFLSASIETNVATKTTLNALVAIGDEGLGPLVRALNAIDRDIAGAAYKLLLEHPQRRRTLSNFS